jgi:hypothetical protein
MAASCVVTGEDDANDQQDGRGVRVELSARASLIQGEVKDQQEVES